jgi:hypothetical protein
VRARLDGKRYILYRITNGNASVDAEGNLVGFAFGPEVTEEVELRVAA